MLGSVWGGSFLFVRVAGPALGPFVTAELRVGIASVALLLYAVAIKHRLSILHKWKEFLVIGALNAAIPFVLIATSELNVTASLASILNATTPAFTAVVAWIWIKEALGLKKITGLIIGVIGVVILVGWSPIPLSGKLLLSVGFSLSAALFYGISGIYVSQVLKGIKPIDLAIGQQISATLLLLPLALSDFPTEVPSLSVIGSILGLAILSTAFAYPFYFRLLKNIGPVKTLSVTFLVPIFGTLWGYLFLQESIYVTTYLGMAIIFVGIMFVTNSWPNLSRKQKTDVSQ